MRSSAKRRECIGGQPGPSVTPERLLSSKACWRWTESSFIARTKRHGKSVQPCRSPRLALNRPKDWPLITPEKVGYVMHEWTQSMKSLWNPWCWRAWAMKDHSILSKAFARSILNIMKADCFQKLRSKEGTISWAITILLVICLPWMKACWLGWMY